MNHVNKTLYIPLYGKASVSKKGIILHDPKAEEIWEKEGFLLKGKAKSKWLSYYMGMRAAVFDGWLSEQIKQRPDSVVIHIGCGMDSRILRTGGNGIGWYDIDFPEVMKERLKYYAETEHYHMIGSDVRRTEWLSAIPSDRNAVVVMEGVSMYLKKDELLKVLSGITDHFLSVQMLVDCYTVFAAKASKYKNPINEVGVTELYGIDDPHELEQQTQLEFIQEHPFTPDDMINELQGMERYFFRWMFGGSMAKKIYRLYEFAAVNQGHPREVYRENET